MGQFAETQFAEFGKLSPYLAQFAEKVRQTVPQIRQFGFRQTGHIPLNMGQFAETQTAEFGELSLPCPVCRKKFGKLSLGFGKLGFGKLGFGKLGIYRNMFSSI